jgi:ceramide glucosyltransferase
VTSAIELLLLTLIAGSLGFYFACAFCTQQFFIGSESSLTQLPANAIEPPVSILIPVRGIDAGAWENWSSLLKQDYPAFEVLFGVTEADDPAVPTLQQLVAAFPHRSQLFIDLKPRGINLKDSNLSYLLEAAQHDVIVFADSDIRVSPDYLRTVTAPLADPAVGMVTCCFIGFSPRSLSAAVAAVGRCCDFVPSLLIARVLDGGLRCAVGATIAMRREVLNQVGGLHLNRIGSDYNLGKRTAAAGYRVELSHYVLDSDTSNEPIADLLQRELRWSRTIRFNRGAVYYSMAFCYGTVYCLPLLGLTGFQSWAVVLTLTVWLIRYTQVLVAIVSMNAPHLLRWLWILPLRDCLSFVIWFLGAFGQTVYWRGRKLKIQADGLITPWN